MQLLIQIQFMLNILYQDEHIIAIQKPHNLLVHRTQMDAHERDFAMQRLRDQIEQKVYPAHRLDKPTAGVLLFGLHQEALAKLNKAFQEQTIHKRYLAIVRGYAPDEIIMDRPILSMRKRVPKEALTEIKCLAKAELPIELSIHKTARFSLVEAFPKTGRTHQIRKHCKYMSHPILGDTKHGDRVYNRYVAEHWGMTNLLLLAQSIRFVHPYTEKEITIESPLTEVMQQMTERLFGAI